MGKPGNKNQSKISNIYGRVPGANDISKDRYTDPQIEGLGSPYDQTFWEKTKKWASDVKNDPMSVVRSAVEGYKDVGEKVVDYFKDKPSDDGWTYPKSNKLGTGGIIQRYKNEDGIDSVQVRNIMSNNKDWTTIKPKPNKK